MRADDLLKLIKPESFRPFRIALSNGTTYEVNYPQLVIVEPFYVTLGIPGPKGPDAPVDRIIHLTIRHINSVEFIRTVAAG